MKYPKINTLYKRDENKVITLEYSQPEFANINRWQVFEKINGMNIRIEWNWRSLPDALMFNGRSDDAELPPHLLGRLQSLFTEEKMLQVFGKEAHVIIFAEGYGAGIHEGHKYCRGQHIRVFDIWIDDWWLETAKMDAISSALQVGTAPFIGGMSTRGVIDFVSTPQQSMITDNKHNMEGVVCRTSPLLLSRDKVPLKFKLKHKDFTKIGGRQGGNNGQKTAE